MPLIFINPNATEEMTKSCITATHKLIPPSQIIGLTNHAGPPAIQGAADGEKAIPGVLSLISQYSSQPQKRHVDVEGFIIGCFDDTGLSEARQRTTYPVVGIGQAAFHVACLSKGQFLVLTTLAPSVPVIEDNICNYGFSKVCCGVFASGIPVLELEHNPEVSVTELERQIKDLAAKFPDVAIVLGCAGMSGLMGRLKERCPGVVLVDPVLAGVAMLKALVDLENLGDSRLVPTSKL